MEQYNENSDDAQSNCFQPWYIAVAIYGVICPVISGFVLYHYYVARWQIADFFGWSFASPWNPAIIMLLVALIFSVPTFFAIISERFNEYI